MKCSDSESSDNYEEDQDNMTESSVSTHIHNKRKQNKVAMSLNQPHGLENFISPRIMDYNRNR